jgi:hypothetical protein
LIYRIVYDYSDLLDDYTLNHLLSVTVGNTEESALKLTEFILNQIEQKELRVYDFVVIESIANLDINTVHRLFNMKHLDLGDYEYKVAYSYQALMEHSKTKLDDVIIMIKLLDDHYNITQSEDLVLAAAVSLPVLKFLVSHPNSSPSVVQRASDLLLMAKYR